MYRTCDADCAQLHAGLVPVSEAPLPSSKPVAPSACSCCCGMPAQAALTRAPSWRPTAQTGPNGTVAMAACAASRPRASHGAALPAAFWVGPAQNGQAQGGWDRRRGGMGRRGCRRIDPSHLLDPSHLQASEPVHGGRGRIAATGGGPRLARHASRSSPGPGLPSGRAYRRAGPTVGPGIAPLPEPVRPAGPAGIVEA